MCILVVNICQQAVSHCTQPNLDASCVLDVRSTAEIDEWSAAIHSRRRRVNPMMYNVRMRRHICGWTALCVYYCQGTTSLATFGNLTHTFNVHILFVDDAELELVVLEHLAKLLFRHCQTLEGLLVLDDLGERVNPVEKGLDCDGVIIVPQSVKQDAFNRTKNKMKYHSASNNK